MPKKRDEMIAYASEKKRTEIVAWLLEYKNRTADLAAEQRKAEKKLMRELNRAPDAVDALKKLWSYKKQEDGTLIITSYKGTDTEVTVPEKIGRSIVTAVGSAFSGMSGDGTPKITLPKTLQYIESCAFHRLWGLEEIQIPDGVKAIGDFAFYECERIRDIEIPDQVKRIGERFPGMPYAGTHHHPCPGENDRHVGFRGMPYAGTCHHFRWGGAAWFEGVLELQFTEKHHHSHNSGSDQPGGIFYVQSA